MDADYDQGVLFIKAANALGQPKVTFNIVGRNRRTNLFEITTSQYEAFITEISQFTAEDSRPIINSAVGQANLLTTHTSH